MKLSLKLLLPKIGKPQQLTSLKQRSETMILNLAHCREKCVSILIFFIQHDKKM